MIIEFWWKVPLRKAMRAKLVAHPIEEVGARLRAMMPWIGANQLVDMDKN
jgi:ketol-acid reductoisomerase